MRHGNEESIAVAEYPLFLHPNTEAQVDAYNCLAILQEYVSKMTKGQWKDRLFLREEGVIVACRVPVPVGTKMDEIQIEENEVAAYWKQVAGREGEAKFSDFSDLLDPDRRKRWSMDDTLQHRFAIVAVLRLSKDATDIFGPPAFEQGWTNGNSVGQTEPAQPYQESFRDPGWTNGNSVGQTEPARLYQEAFRDPGSFTQSFGAGRSSRAFRARTQSPSHFESWCPAESSVRASTPPPYETWSSTSEDGLGSRSEHGCVQAKAAADTCVATEKLVKWDRRQSGRSNWNQRSDFEDHNHRSWRDWHGSGWRDKEPAWHQWSDGRKWEDREENWRDRGKRHERDSWQEPRRDARDARGSRGWDRWDERREERREERRDWRNEWRGIDTSRWQGPSSLDVPDRGRSRGIHQTVPAWIRDKEQAPPAPAKLKGDPGIRRDVKTGKMRLKLSCNGCGICPIPIPALSFSLMFLPEENPFEQVVNYLKDLEIMLKPSLS
eukprot:s1316_g11.t1